MFSLIKDSIKINLAVPHHTITNMNNKKTNDSIYNK